MPGPSSNPLFFAIIIILNEGSSEEEAEKDHSTCGEGGKMTPILATTRCKETGAGGGGGEGESDDEEGSTRSAAVLFHRHLLQRRFLSPHLNRHDFPELHGIDLMIFRSGKSSSVSEIGSYHLASRTIPIRPP